MDPEELKIDLDISRDDEDVRLTSDSAFDELMSALDVLDGHADDSIQASRDTEMYWITTLNERDELILSNKKTITELQQLNSKLLEENRLLREQLSSADRSTIVSALQDDASQSRELSLQLQSELADLQISVVSRLKEQNVELQDRLVKCGRHYSEVFKRLRDDSQRQHPRAADIEKAMKKLTAEEQEKMKQVEDLCDRYNQLINQACDECEDYLQRIDALEYENTQLSARGGSSVSPRKGRPGSSLDTDKYYTQLLQSSENANHELRKEVERLHKEMNSREQKLFDESMARTGNTQREQTEKLKVQISQLSQEMSLLNVDNRALRERILKTENENEILVKRVQDSSLAEEELTSLQSNLDGQLDLNHQLESKVKQLELIQVEHNSICQRTRTELEESKRNEGRYESAHKQLCDKLRESKELQQKYDAMNSALNDKLLFLTNENTSLSEEVKGLKRELQMSQEALTMHDLTEQDNSDELANQLKEAEEKHKREMASLDAKLESTEKQRQHANMKVKALRERLKNMQDSWQKISTDTETSFTALRDQYQQQIKEYKSIVESLKSQNSSLNTRIDSLKKVTSQHTANQVNSLEQQIVEYKRITDGYREENILLRKELHTIVQELQSPDKDTSSNQNEFAKLRDILSTAKSECENLQLHKPSQSRTSSAERRPSHANSREPSFETSKELSKKTTEKSSVPNAYNMEDLYDVTSSRTRTQLSGKDEFWSKSESSKFNLKTEPEPLAISTPRKIKSAEHSVRPELTPSKTLEKETTPIPAKSTERDPFRYPTAPVRPSENRTRRKYESLGNLRSAESSSAINRGMTTLPTDHQTSRTTSLTKEVVEIKTRNSAELDPSKSFKPINPDDEAMLPSDSSHNPPSYVSIKPSLLPSSYKYHPTSTSSYERPYRSKYEPSSYKSKYSLQDVKPSTNDYRNMSADSAYGSPSRSFSKAPSITSHSSSYRKDYTLPSLATTKGRYPSAAAIDSKDSLTKLLDYENRQTDLLNRTLDDLEISMDSISNLTQQDKYELEQSTSYTKERFYPRRNGWMTSTSMRNPPSTTSVANMAASADIGSRYSYKKPKTISFHGTVVYESIYK